MFLDKQAKQLSNTVILAKKRIKPFVLRLTFCNFAVKKKR